MWKGKVTKKLDFNGILWVAGLLKLIGLDFMRIQQIQYHGGWLLVLSCIEHSNLSGSSSPGAGPSLLTTVLQQVKVETTRGPCVKLMLKCLHEGREIYYC